jgi:hypothetical protein
MVSRLLSSTIVTGFCIAALVAGQSASAQQQPAPVAFGAVPAALAAPPPPQSKSILDRLADQGFSLRQGVDGGDTTKGAAFSFDRESGHVGGFQSQFALTLVRPINGPASFDRPALFLWSDVDGDLSTGTFKKNTFLNVRPQIGGLLPLDAAPTQACFFDPQCAGAAIANFPAIVFRTGPVFEATQDFKVQNLMFEINATPTWGNAALNSYKPINEVLSYRITPYLDLQAGTNLKGRSNTLELQRTRLRIIPHVALEFDDFGYFAHPLSFKNIMLTFDDQVTALPLENESTTSGVHGKSVYNMFTGSLDMAVNDDISFGPSLSFGQAPPTFQRNTKFLLSLKIAFGRDPMLAALPEPKF